MSMPSRAYTSFLRNRRINTYRRFRCVSMPSQASTSLLRNVRIHGIPRILIVSMPSRASTSLLLVMMAGIGAIASAVSMPSRASTSLLHRLKILLISENILCQCPLGLVPHCYLYHILSSVENNWVSMPSRASTSSLPIKSRYLRYFVRAGVNALSG